MMEPALTCSSVSDERPDDRTCTIIDPGEIDYGEALSLQGSLLAASRLGMLTSALVVLEHTPVITLGKSSPEDEAARLAWELRDRKIPVVRVNRGGRATFHGPGQLVVYPIIRLKSDGVVDYVRNLEQVIVDTLHYFSIQGGRRQGYPGVWVEGKKIASIGIAVSRGMAYHGLALNVCTDMSYFRLIQPCGLTAEDMTSMEQVVGYPIKVSSVKAVLVTVYGRLMGVVLQRLDIAKARTQFEKKAG